MTGLGRIDPESERVQQGMPRRRYLDDTNVVERGHRGIKLRVAPRDGELHVTDRKAADCHVLGIELTRSLCSTDDNRGVVLSCPARRHNKLIIPDLPPATGCAPLPLS